MANDSSCVGSQPSTTPPVSSVCPIGDTDSVVEYPVYEIPEEIEEVKIGIVTEENPISGIGQFDKYMRAGSEQLNLQYEKGRIKGADYATAFSAMQEGMMAQANKFIIDKYTAEVMTHKAYIEMEEMLKKGILERKLLELKIIQGEMDLRLTIVNIQKETNQTQLICTQEEETRKKGITERNVANEGIKKIQAEVSSICTNEKETIKTGVLLREKLEEEIDFLQTQDSEMIKNGIENRLKTEEEVDLLQTQDSELKLNGIESRLKIKEEVDLLQTQDTELKLNGTSKRELETAQALAQREQVGLYRAQAKGFADKNRNDTFKSTLNAWAIHATEVDEDPMPVPQLSNTSVSGMITSARSQASV